MVGISKVTDFLSGLFLRQVKNNHFDLTDCVESLTAEYFYKEMAVEACIGMIAQTISQCEFITYDKGVPKRGGMYYLLNVAPNQNQNASVFIHKLVGTLLRYNECLVVQSQDGKLYVADSFDRTPYAFYENVYTNIEIDGLLLDRTYLESDVLSFKLNDKDVKRVMDNLYESYGLMISSAIGAYKRANAKRYVVKGIFKRAQDDKTQEAADSLFERQMEKWMKADKETAVMQLPKDYELDDKSSQSSGMVDFKTLADGVIEYAAMAFHIPVHLIKGDTVGLVESMDMFLMFCINPIAILLSDEINRKLYSKQDYLERSYVDVDTKNIKMVDEVKFATAVDKLFSIGGLTINDILEKLGKNPIDEEWADMRFVTKNYESAENHAKGGEAINENKQN